ncbi:MAG TPA: hypothetical protein VI072_33000 [Polyangiaceae bacterium]
MRLLKLAFPLLGVVMFGACGSGSDGGGNCADYSGRWSISGDCPEVTECDAEQNGCQITFNCDDNSKLTGRVSGDEINFSNDDVDCSIDLDNVEEGEQPQGNGTCDISGGGSCEFTTECESGKCLQAGNGGTGGSGSGGRAGSGGSGGSGGGPPLDPECELGTDAYCTCAKGTENECTPPEAITYYEGCVDEDPEIEPVLKCFASYVENGLVACDDANENCFPVGPGEQSVRALRR